MIKKECFFHSQLLIVSEGVKDATYSPSREGSSQMPVLKNNTSYVQCRALWKCPQKPAARSDSLRHECGLTVLAVCLGASVAMAKLLGCRVLDWSFDDLKTHFPNLVDDQKDIFMVFDACHGLKLLRDALHQAGALTFAPGAQSL